MTTEQTFAQRRLEHADMVLYFRGKYTQGDEFETYRAARMLLWQAVNRVRTGDEPEPIEPYDQAPLLLAREAFMVLLEQAPRRVRNATVRWLADKYSDAW